MSLSHATTRQPRRKARTVGLVLAAAVAAGLSGCAFLRNIAGATFEPPTLTFESWSLHDLDLEGVTIALRYRLENPNRVSFKLARLTYALDIDGSRLTAGELPAAVEFPAHGAAPLVVPVRLMFRDLPGLLEILLTRSAIPYRVTGTATVDSPVGRVDLPFDHADDVSLPRPPFLPPERKAPLEMRDMAR